MYNYWVWAQSRRIHLSGYVLRIDFKNFLKQRRQKMYQKFYGRLIRCLGIYFSIEILNKSMLKLIISFSALYWISYSLRICLQFSKCGLYNKNSRKYTKMFVNNETFHKPIAESNYLFSMIRVDFYFLNLFLNNWLVYSRIFDIFLSSLFNSFKIIDSLNVTTQMDDFERRLCAQIQSLYIIKAFYMSQMNPKIFSTILHSQFNYYTWPVTPFKPVSK